MVGFFRFDHLRVRPLTLHVLQWGSFFNPGRSLALYLAHLGEACQLRSIPHYWYMAALRGVSKDISLIWGRHASCLTYHIIGIWLLPEALLKGSRTLMIYRLNWGTTSPWIFLVC